MKIAGKIIEFIGIVVTGIGLFYGLLQHDMGQEFFYMGAGILVFMIGMLIERRG
jgi:hypothetical protein